MNFKVGDKVQVKTLSELLATPGTSGTENFINGPDDAMVTDMLALCGKTVTIIEQRPNKYRIYEESYNWYDWMLKPMTMTTTYLLQEELK